MPEVKQLSNLGSYLPSVLLRDIREFPTEMLAPRVQKFTGAVLNADISGFTALTEKLAMNEQYGAEEITKFLNNYFTEVIDILSSFGGDVLKFEGDAVVVVWRVKKETSIDLRAVASLASSCAMHLASTRMRLKDVLCSLHIGVSVGDFYLYYIGGVRDRWDWIVGGEPIGRASVCEHIASGGQVVVCKEVWALIKDMAIGVPVTGGNTLLKEMLEKQEQDKNGMHQERMLRMNVTSEMEIPMRAFVPMIVQRNTEGNGNWDCELRTMSIIFLKVKHASGTFVWGPESLEFLHAMMKQVQVIIYRYEGSLNKLLMGDNGVIFLIGFGLPPVCHEDDPHRAVKAAMQMKEDLESNGLCVTLGITSGRAFCGSYGSRYRREYGLLGDLINLAARLMQNEEHPMLVDFPTYKATKQRFVYEEVAPISVKGKSGKISVYIPTCEKQRNKNDWQDLGEFVGREAELKVFQSAATHCLKGEGSVILVEGEVGLGKTALLQQMKGITAKNKMGFLCGVTESTQKNTPFFVWSQIIGDVLLTLADGKMDKLEDNLYEFTRNNMSYYVNYLPLLTMFHPLKLSENGITKNMDSESRLQTAQNFAVTLLELVVHKQPTVIFVEDVHWMDPQSWNLLFMALKKLRSSLFVISSRPCANAEYLQLCQHPLLKVISLDNMSIDETEQLMRLTLNGEVTPSLVEAVFRRAEGNPFFTEQLTMAMQESNIIRMVDDMWTFAKKYHSKVFIPSRLQSVVTARIDQLSNPQKCAYVINSTNPVRMVLKIASVIGTLFNLRELSAIHPDKRIPSLLAKDLDTINLVRANPEVPDEYMFKNGIVHEIVYGLLLNSQREQIHAALAAYYEEVYQRNLSKYYYQLAHHWKEAREKDKAMYYMNLFGEQCMETFDYVVAVEVFSKLVEEYENDADDVTMASWQRRLGQAYSEIGQWTEALKHLSKALTALDEHVPGSSFKLKLAVAKEKFVQSMHRKFPSRAKYQGSNDQTLQHAFDVVSILRCLSMGTLHLGDLKMRNLAVWACLRCLNLAEQLPSVTAELALAYAWAAVFAADTKSSVVPAAYLRAAEAILSRLNDDLTKAQFYVYRSLYYCGMTNWVKAEEVKQAINIYESCGADHRLAEAKTVLALGYHFRGKIDESLQVYKGILELGNLKSLNQVKLWGHIGQGQSFVLMEDFDSAVMHLKEAEAILDESSSFDRIWAFGMLALALYKQDEPSAAENYCSIVLSALAENPPLTCTHHESIASCVRMRLAQLEDTQSYGEISSKRQQMFAKKAEAALKMFSNYAATFKTSMPRYIAYEGMYMWLIGKKDKAHEKWKAAIMLAEELGMFYEQGLCHHYIAKFSGSLSFEEVQEHLHQAHDLWNNCGIVGGRALYKVTANQSTLSLTSTLE